MEQSRRWLPPPRENSNECDVSSCSEHHTTRVSEIEDLRDIVEPEERTPELVGALVVQEGRRRLNEAGAGPAFQERHRLLEEKECDLPVGQLRPVADLNRLSVYSDRGCSQSFVLLRQVCVTAFRPLR